MYDQNPMVKPLVLFGVCLAACYFFWKSGSYPPPDDPWFQIAVLDHSGPVLVKFGATCAARVACLTANCPSWS